jgi:hypothetical protein
VQAGGMTASATPNKVRQMCRSHLLAMLLPQGVDGLHRIYLQKHRSANGLSDFARDLTLIAKLLRHFSTELCIKRKARSEPQNEDNTCRIPIYSQSDIFNSVGGVEKHQSGNRSRFARDEWD